MSKGDLNRLSMFELFRMEVENQIQVLTPSLLVLEKDPTNEEHLENCMRSAHSLKGAARIIGLSAAVSVAHIMEECFVSAQQNLLRLKRHHIDVLLAGMDLLQRIAKTPEHELPRWENELQGDITAYGSRLEQAIAAVETISALPANPSALEADANSLESQESARVGADNSARMLRVTAGNLNRLLALTGESLVESRSVHKFSNELQRLKRMQGEVSRSLNAAIEKAAAMNLKDESLDVTLSEAQQKLMDSQQFLAQRMSDIEAYDYRYGELADRLYYAALACRMRPFADGVVAFPRQVRDLCNVLGKKAQLQIVGESTLVDRDILERLDAPIGHLLRNALDHGLETPDERRAAQKPETGTIRLDARHSAGALHITVTDDGRGIDLNRLRNTLLTRQLVNQETVQRLSDQELLDFLFLPGFSMKDTVTEVSGRGVGLDVVHDMMRQVRGSIRVNTHLGQGSSFLMQLPLTLSVLRSLLVSIAGEPYAFPLAAISSTTKIRRDSVEWIEGRQYFSLDGKQHGMVGAHQVLEKSQSVFSGDEYCVLLLGKNGESYGLVVDRFLGERELVVQPLDSRLGKVQNIMAGALMEDGTPVLIVDVDDILLSIDKLITLGQITNIRDDASANAARAKKRILVVDDSLTVRELERKLLDSRGYQVEIAVDGVDGWNAVRTGRYDLIITDVDMPRMNGIELVSLIKKDPHLKQLTVMIVSYKDRAEDRHRGLEAGADYYLTKGSFHEETLLQAVVDLIGEAEQ